MLYIFPYHVCAAFSKATIGGFGGRGRQKMSCNKMKKILTAILKLSFFACIHKNCSQLQLQCLI